MSAAKIRNTTKFNRAAALVALRRARKRAEKIAVATGTKIVQAKKGVPVLITPK